MKAKSFLIFVLGCMLTGVLVSLLMSVTGVEMTGPNWAQVLIVVAIAFAGIGMWEFIGSVGK